MLSVKNLNKTYSDGTKALNNINLELPTGMVGLLGANGAGKSSFMRTLATLQLPNTGKITFNNIDVLQQPTQLRALLGYLPQSFGAYPHMTCQALLHHIAVLKKLSTLEAKQQIDSLLSLTNLTKYKNKTVTKFSGGMLQRFGIAQALLGDPQLIILDEPTAGLDPQERERLHDLLFQLSKNKLILLSTHIVEDIENLCHHVTMIDSGNIIESNNIEALIKPLTGKVWQSSFIPDSTSLKSPQKTLVLSKNYRLGQPVYKIYSDLAPTPNAKNVQASLQDRYFYEQKMKEISSC